MTTEAISDFVFPQTFVCGTCQSDVTILDVGISVSGQVVVATHCEPCDRRLALYLDYDNMLMASHVRLMEKMRK